MRVTLSVLSVLCALVLARPVFSQEAAAVIWHDRGDVTALDFGGAPLGTERGPGLEFTFVSESTNGTSPKFVVEDEYGTTWKVKLGDEAKSETAATRLLWAMGYVVDLGYYRPSARVKGMPMLARGQRFVTNGDTVTGLRLERARGGQASEAWSWYDNPFVGTREFNGLRVMMALMNNWDLKNVNNGATHPAGGGGEYGVTDLGAAFGRTGNPFTRSKGVLKDYADTRFIDEVTPTHVDFVMRSRPFFLSAVNIPNYRLRTRMERVAKDIPIDDARWIGARLGQLSVDQLNDVFRTAGFTAVEVEGYTRAVQRRIAALIALSPSTPAESVESRTEGTAPTEVTRDSSRCRTSTCRQAPVRETLTAIGIGTPYAQAMVGGFEQGAGVGGGAQVTTADAIPGVTFRAAALTSTKRYRRFDAEAFLPNIRGSRNHADVWFSHMERDLDFFGIGPRTPTTLGTRFAVVQRSYQGTLSRDLAAHVQAGVYAQVMETQSSRGSDATITPIDELFPGTPDLAVSRWIPAFGEPPRIVSYGAFLEYDTRDNRVGLTRGVNLYGRVSSADGRGGRQAPVRYGWTEREFDVRGYIPLGSPRTSLLVRHRGQFKAPGAGNQIPFTNLAWLGGRQYLRGYHSYRFRGNNMVLVSMEVQQTLRSMTPTRGIDVYGLADTGQVWGDARSTTDPTVLDGQAFSSRNWHTGVGTGLQYRHSPSVAARIEVGRSREGTEIYVTLSRGF